LVNRFPYTLGAITIVTAGLCLAVVSAAPPAGRAEGAEQDRPGAAGIPTFNKDVAPILYKNCTGCHRPGEIGPMSLMTYNDARPHAKAIRDEVGDGNMPPWHADPKYGRFMNDRSLSEKDRETLLRWVNNGAPEGNKADLPPAPRYEDGWSIGTPDVVFDMPEAFTVPAEGMIEYEYFYVPTNFGEPKWVDAIEIRPGNRELVHHVLAYYVAEPDVKRQPLFQRNQAQSTFPDRKQQPTHPRRNDKTPKRLIATYAPGTNPQVFRPGTAVRLEAGGVIEFQMHYTANGKAGTDRSKIGLRFSRDPKPREILVNHFYNASFKLPAGQENIRVDAELTFVSDTVVYGLFPHTHVRGNKWEYTLELPDGTKKTILSVPRYDFNWQTYYMFAEPLTLPKGSKLVSSAWYDNSSRNKSNPDSKSDVTWGDQTWEEMQYTGILYSPASAAATTSSAGGVR
jgi:hypothetical protein